MRVVLRCPRVRQAVGWKRGGGVKPGLPPHKAKQQRLSTAAGAPISTNSSLTLRLVLALVSMWKMPFSFAYSSASCAKQGVSGEE